MERKMIPFDYAFLQKEGAFGN